MKKRCLSLLLTLCLLAALAVPAFAQEAEKQPTLQPASEHPSVLLNTPAVEIPADRGLMNGTGPVTFEPDSTMTRAMLVTVLWRSAGSPNEGTNGFTDVPADQWYTQAVAWAAQNGIVNGVGNNKFDPDAKITREQLAAVLYRYAGKVGMDVTARADLKLFPDAGSVSAYATDALSWCVANGIVNGTLEHGTAYLDPQGSATRAQVATLMSRYLKLTEA